MDWLTQFFLKHHTQGPLRGDLLGLQRLARWVARTFICCDFDTSVDAPEPRDLYEENAGTLQAKVDLAPEVFAAESSQAYGQPAYARLAMSIMEEQLPGLLDIYEDTQSRTNELNAGYTTATREAELADVERLAPGYRAALDAANPEQAALRNELTQQAQDELALGSSLSPEELAMGDEAVRSAYFDRGRGYGTPAITAEVLNRYGLGEQRQQQRRGFAQGVLNTVSATSIDPAAAVLGRTSTTPSLAAGLFGQASNTNTQAGYFNPMDAYAADLYNTNYNAEAAANIATGNNNSALLSGAMSMAGDALGFCWVARQAFGTRTDRWTLFRLWLLLRAPRWLADAYRTYGAEIADGLSRVPWCKPFVRALMNLAITRLKL